MASSLHAPLPLLLLLLDQLALALALGLLLGLLRKQPFPQSFGVCRARLLVQLSLGLLSLAVAAQRVASLSAPGCLLAVGPQHLVSAFVSGGELFSSGLKGMVVVLAPSVRQERRVWTRVAQSARVLLAKHKHAQLLLREVPRKVQQILVRCWPRGVRWADARHVLLRIHYLDRTAKRAFHMRGPRVLSMPLPALEVKLVRALGEPQHLLSSIERFETDCTVV